MNVPVFKFSKLALMSNPFYCDFEIAVWMRDDILWDKRKTSTGYVALSADMGGDWRYPIETPVYRVNSLRGTAIDRNVPHKPF